MKRSSQVALLLMGTVAVGGGAYALMPSEKCPPSQPGIVQQNQNCGYRGNVSSGGSYGRPSSSQQAFSGNASSSGGSSTTTPVARGGFGSFSSHFSGGG